MRKLQTNTKNEEIDEIMSVNIWFTILSCFMKWSLFICVLNVHRCTKFDESANFIFVACVGDEENSN